MLRYVCSSCSSFRGWYAARQPARERRGGGPRVSRAPRRGCTGADGSRVALIYRGNRSLFLSRRPSRPPNFDRYRLVIAFRYLNISAARNLLDELEARVASRALRDSSSLTLNRYCTFYRLVAVRRFVIPVMARRERVTRRVRNRWNVAWNTQEIRCCCDRTASAY